MILSLLKQMELHDIPRDCANANTFLIKLYFQRGGFPLSIPLCFAYFLLLLFAYRVFKTSLSCQFFIMLSSFIDDLMWQTNWYENVTEIGLKCSPLHSQLYSTDRCIPHPHTQTYVYTVTQWAAADNACVIYGLVERKREKRTPSEGEASDLCN